MPEAALEPSRPVARLVYKSGNTIDIECDSFKVNSANGAITSVEWVAPSPRPLFIGVDELESVWDVTL